MPRLAYNCIYWTQELTLTLEQGRTISPKNISRVMNDPWFLGWKIWSSNVVHYMSIYGNHFPKEEIV